jgi:hypothetical protein
MRKLVVALVAAFAIAASSLAVSGSAEASSSGRALTYGILGGVAAGALIAGAPYYAPPPPPPPYYAPAPAYYAPPPCRWVRERYWDGYYWQVRRVQVCP